MEIYTIGGYNEVGKNMTVVDLGEDAVIFDAGLYLPPIVELEEKDVKFNEKELRAVGALPADTILDKKGVREKVRAILVGHAHLDHVGALPYLANRYKADVIGTPFTTEVLKTLLNDKNSDQVFRNQIVAIQPNSSYIIKGKTRQYKVDFINITHSTIQTSLIALHTPEGVVLYANDFKLDNNPIVGKRPNYEKIKEIAKEGVKVLIVDSLYSSEESKTPSEKVARYLLEDVMLTTDNSKSGMIITTFSSHIARLKSIVDFGKQLNRKIIFLGRSLNKYVTAAEKVKMCPFYHDVAIAGYKNQINSILNKVNKNKPDYLVVCTGHQGEPGSILSRISNDEMPLSISNKDHVIFSSRVIPTPINIANREKMEKRIKKKGARIFSQAHVSGHACREDLRDFIGMVQPQHIIPAHGDVQKTSPMMELAEELGYKSGKTCHLMQDLQMLKI